jgi:hypothetical protein
MSLGFRPLQVTPEMPVADSEQGSPPIRSQHVEQVRALERHARLFFNAARTVVEVVLQTWHQRKCQGAN